MPELLCVERRHDEMPYVVVRDPSRPFGPVVVVQHGYTGSIETELPYGRKFAEAGYTAIVTEAEWHGHRKTDAGSALFDKDFARAIGIVVEKSIVEIHSLLDHLEVERAGFFGISMGGFIGFRLASEDPRVAVLCAQISSPLSFWADQLEDAERVRSLDPSRHPERLHRCAVLMQNGTDDDVVPIRHVRTLYENLKGAMPEDCIRLIEYPGKGHEVPEEMVVQALAWTRRHLPVPQ